MGPLGKGLLIGGPIAVVLVVLIGVAVFGGGSDTVSEPPPVVTSPSRTSEPTPSATPTPSPTPSPSQETTQSYDPPTVDTSTVGGKRTGPYKEFPQLTNNALYGVKLGRWSCGVNPVVPDGKKALEGWMNGVVDCMMDRFGPVVAKEAGKKLPRPKVIYYSGTVDTPCGRMDDRVPYYCGSPQSMAIYVSPATIRRYDDGVRLGAVHVIFHEFAHHVQYQFGLLTAGFNAGVEDPLQASRRVELQAECISWSQTTLLAKPAFGARDAQQMWRWVSMGQDAKHGTASSHQYWYKRIERKGNLGLCNTWVAAKSHVR